MIEYNGLPLFGKDSSPHNTSKFLGFIGTCVFWFIFLICMIFVKPKEKVPKYKEVQIVLESAPVENIETKDPPKKIENQASTSKSQEEKKVVEEKKPVKSTSANSTENKKVPAKKNNVPAKKNPEPIVEEVWEQEYFDPMEQFAQQTSQTNSKEVDWDAMFEEEQIASSSGSSGGKVVGENTFQGAASSAVSKESGKTTSSQVSSDNANWEVSSGTSDALKNISNARYVSNSGNDISSETNVDSTRRGDGKVLIKMSNGRARALIRPSSPVIYLSDEASSLIDGSRNVTIRFMVMKKGTVPASQITITPAALLPSLVQQEIKDQISLWVFESDDYDAFAEFDYNIVKK